MPQIRSAVFFTVFRQLPFHHCQAGVDHQRYACLKLLLIILSVWLYNRHSTATLMDKCIISDENRSNKLYLLSRSSQSTDDRRFLFNPWSAEFCYKNLGGQNIFFQFEIIINVLVSSFRFIWIHMLWVYDHYIYFFQCGDRLYTSESDVCRRLT